MNQMQCGILGQILEQKKDITRKPIQILMESVVNSTESMFIFAFVIVL